VHESLPIAGASPWYGVAASRKRTAARPIAASLRTDRLESIARQ
jgi:hypothetical protein